MRQELSSVVVCVALICAVMPGAQAFATCSPGAAAVNAPQSDVVWMEDEWSRYGVAWPTDTTEHASGAASFFAAPQPFPTRSELITNLEQPQSLSHYETFIAYVLISCSEASAGIGVEITLDDYSLQYYWGDQVVFDESGGGSARLAHTNSVVLGPPIRIGDLPASDTWVRLEVPIEQGGTLPSVWGLSLVSTGGTVRWDHIGWASKVPTTTSITPTYGDPAGGTTVSIEGSGFFPGQTVVRFASATASAMTLESSTRVTAVTPSGSGTVDVAVEREGITSTLPGAFTYTVAPTLSGITPSKGKMAGGETVTIIGTGFVNGNTAITFGGVAAAIASPSTTSLQATTPEHAAGAVDVVVTTPGGSFTLAEAFHYLPPPSINSFQPSQGQPGSTVVITGANFDSELTANAVTIGDIAATVVSAYQSQLTIVVPSNGRSGLVSVSTAGGTATSTTQFVVPTYVSIEVAPAALTIDSGDTQQLAAAGISATGTRTDITSQVAWLSSSPSILTVSASGLVQGMASGTASVTATFENLSASCVVTVVDAMPLPPDPSSVAPALDRTVPTTLLDSTSFLYTGANAIQLGVTPGTIAPDRVAVLRGRVLERDGSALRGAMITIAGHGEYGSTLSRADGMFDLVINGGGAITVHYERSGYLPAERRLAVNWQDQLTLDDVVLIPQDTTVTTVLMNSSNYVVAQGSLTADARGARRATLLFQPNTTATLHFPDNSTASAPELHLRATEYSTGTWGPNAMPGTLPPQSGYTYCVDLSADEETTTGATTITFNQPVFIYVDNFLALPAGTIVPSAYYDNGSHVWVPSPNGLVIKILSASGGAATLDSNGDGVAESSSALAAIGIATGELAQLATRYAPGQSIWRMPVAHFSAYDYNMPVGPPVGANPPPAERPSDAYWIRGGHRLCGWSTIDCENQTLIESIPVEGTPYSLEYDSGRASRSQYKVTVPVSGPTLNPDVQSMRLRILIAGRVFEWNYAPSVNLKQEFEWDGTDVYGRVVQGATTAQISVIHLYPAVYYRTLRLNAFGLPADTSVALQVATGVLRPVSNNWTVTLGRMDMKPTGFGGWTFSGQAFYDSRGQAIYFPNGVVRNGDAKETGEYTISRVAGTGACCAAGTGGSALYAKLDFPSGIAAAPDGSFYLAEYKRIRRVNRDGIIESIAGTGTYGYTGDGGLATAAQIDVWDVTVGPQGDVYFSQGGTRVRRIDGNGVVTTVAGNGSSQNTGDGGSALAAGLRVEALATAVDGSVYVAATGRIRRISPDGLIATIAGGGNDNSDGVLATTALVQSAVAVAVGPDGSVYFTEANTGLVRRVTPDGIVQTIAGNRSTGLPYVQDGTRATSGRLNKPWGVAVGGDGTVYFTEYSGNRVRAVAPDGIIRTMAGNGGHTFTPPTEGSLARGVTVSASYDLDVAPDGTLLVVDETNTARRITSPFPMIGRDAAAEAVIAAADGATALVFQSGRHVRTVDRLTGVTLETFTYDTKGRVTTIADAYGNATMIERDAAGEATAIVAPGGQRTTLGRTPDGLLSSISGPSGVRGFTYEAGLLETYRDLRQGLHRFHFDTDGRLLRDEDPAGGYVSFTTAATGETFQISRTSAEGRTTTHIIDRAPTFDVARTLTPPDGFVSTTSRGGDGKVVNISPDGASVTTIEAADPVFGVASPLTASTTLHLPSGLQLAQTMSRTVTLATPGNPLSVAQQVDTWIINGKTWRSTYTGATRTAVLRSPAGRETTTVLDAKGRLLSVQQGGLAATAFGYDSRGNLETLTVGARSWAFVHNSQFELTSATDPLGRQSTFSYDTAGRVASQLLPGARTVGLGYDAGGNVTSVQPPNRPAHTFTFTPVDLVSSFAPPLSAPAQIAYNKDRQLTVVTRASGEQIAPTYDAFGRLSGLSTAAGTYTFGYSTTTGKQTSVTSPDGVTVTYAYDGPMITSATWSGNVQGAVARTFNNDLQVASENGVAYGYDADGLLTSAGALILTRDAQTGMLSGTMIGSLVDTIMYNEFGEAIQYGASYGAVQLAAFSYGRDGAGRITSVTETIAGAPAVTFGYEYDPAGRLQRVLKSGAAVAEYGYDTNGNRMSRQYLGGSEAAQYDVEDRLNQYDGTAYAYTADGDLQLMTTSGQTTQFSYDGVGNLHTVTLPSGQVIDYIVDGEQRRVGKVVGGTFVQGWLYADSRRIVAELDRSHSVASTFVYGSRSNLPDYMTREGVQYRLIPDHLGSPRLVVRISDGAIVQEMDYDEFGRVTRDTNPGFQPFGFAGGLYDRDTGLVRFGARDYDPHTGRWTTKDPIGFASGSWNLYTYVDNDPVNWIDPDGLNNRKPGKTPPSSWPKPPKGAVGKKPRWNPNGYWEGTGGRQCTWDNRSHGAGVDRGEGEQGGHWDDENSDNRWDEEGNLLPGSPDLVKAQRTMNLWLVGAGAGLIATTVVEDVLTLGVGILDDPLTVGAGGVLIWKGLTGAPPQQSSSSCGCDL